MKHSTKLILIRNAFYPAVKGDRNTDITVVGRMEMTVCMFTLLVANEFVLNRLGRVEEEPFE